MIKKTKTKQNKKNRLWQNQVHKAQSKFVLQFAVFAVVENIKSTKATNKEDYGLTKLVEYNSNILLSFLYPDKGWTKHIWPLNLYTLILRFKVTRFRVISLRI